MRELIYVSEAKLQQILHGLPGRPGRLRNVDAEVKTPLGGVKIGKAAQPSEPSLAAAVTALESSSRAPKWFADPTASPGQWVHFEAPLSYSLNPLRNADGLRGPVFFVDPNKPSTDYPTAGDVRLLLHGSAIHLLGYQRGYQRSANLWPRSSGWEVAALNDFLQKLDEKDRRLDDGTGFDTGGSLEPDEPRSIQSSVQALSAELDTEHTAAWMAGYARITARFPADTDAMRPAIVLAATPLYVEYIDPPGDAIATT